MFAGDAATCKRQTDSDGLGLVLQRSDRRAADEIAAGEIHGEPKTSLVRIDMLAQLMAIQRHGRFQPQRIASAEARGGDSCVTTGHDLLPYIGGSVGRHDQLAAVLARVTSAAHNALPAENGRFRSLRDVYRVF